MLLKKLAIACNHDMHQASTELRWMVEAILNRRNQSWFKRRTQHALISKLHSNPFQEDPCKIQEFCKTLELKEQQRLSQWVNDRVDRHKPLQYILGTQPFLGNEYKVRPPVLIPRWETEEWTSKIIEIIKRHQKTNSNPLRIMELCSGSGCISIAIALHLQNVSVRGFDVSNAALRLSKINKRNLGPLLNCHFNYTDIMKDGFEQQIIDVSKRMDSGEMTGFDLIIANPPYINPKDYKQLDHSVKNWEDIGALLANDEKGIEFYKRIIEVAPSLLREPLLSVSPSKDASNFSNTYLPAIVFEIGEEQAADVSCLMEPQYQVEVWKDLAKNDRVVVGSRKPKILLQMGNLSVSGTGDERHANGNKEHSAPSKEILSKTRNGEVSNLRLEDNKETSTLKSIKVPEKPQPPTSEECCMSGCVHCVWDMYQEAFDKYSSEMEKLKKKGHDVEIEEDAMDVGMKAFLDMERAIKKDKSK